MLVGLKTRDTTKLRGLPKAYTIKPVWKQVGDRELNSDMIIMYRIIKAFSLLKWIIRSEASHINNNNKRNVQRLHSSGYELAHA